MFGILKHLWQLPSRMLPTPTSRLICGTTPCYQLDACNMYDKLKFEFTEENLCRAKDLISSYPKQEIRAALLPILDLAQRQQGWLPISAITAVAEMLQLEPFVVWEVATFYPMFNLRPMGKFRVKVCTTTPCMLRGSDDIWAKCKEILELQNKETSKDMQFTLCETYCLGACCNAPAMSVNDDLYEDLTVPDVEQILCELKNNKMPPNGPRGGRYASEPKSGLTSLKIDPPPAGYCMQDICAAKKKPPAC